ncbi:MAG: HhH-GPD-type base excision DNA repair protein, partial [Actinomycetota bacterium]
MTLYQQVPVEKAFAGPHSLQERLGKKLDARTIASIDPQVLEDVFREKPALHRFPANMAKRTQAVANFIVDEYDGDPEAIWDGVESGAELLKRIKKMPGFGDYKARVYAAVLAQQFGIKPEGWDDKLPEWPNISEVHSEADRADMKERKKAWKAAQK